jgi:surfeit locus 1 family protein
VPGLTGWRFWVATAGAVLGVALTFSLGAWQWGRGQQRLALQAAIEQRMALPPLDAQAFIDRAGQPESLHRAVRLRGHWLGEHTVFLDNRQVQGRPGFYVVTPLHLSGSNRVALVQRGWAPRNFVDRSVLPPVEMPRAEVEILGRIAPAPAKLYEFEQASSGPIRQNLDWASFREETRLALVEGSVQQVGPPSEGLVRDWPALAAGADKNFGYAFQWWALGGLIFILYVWFQFIGPRRRAARRA